MVMLREFLILSLIVCIYTNPIGRDTDNVHFTIYEVPEQIIFEGYIAERHHVTTEDGYILEMHRIPYKRHETGSNFYRPAVFLMHGLLSASGAKVVLGHEYSLGYNFADAGFDVWMGNARGNKLSRFHTTLDPDDDVDKMKFFDFSWEEIGMIDVAAMVDYVLEYTGKDKLHYVGHSQGGTAFLVLASMKPEYNEKFTTVHLLAGVGYQQFFPDPILSGLSLLSDIIYNLGVSQGIVELFPPGSGASNDSFGIGDLIPDLLPNGYSRGDLCTGDINNRCEHFGLKTLMRDTDNENAEADDVPGAALKQIAHYGQNIRDRAFRRWSYGMMQNLEIYGSITPPEYNLGLITANVTMHYTINDYLLDERDVLAMVDDMPNTVARKVARDDFLHEDFAAATDAKELVTDYMIDAMLYFEDIRELETDGDDGDGDNSTATAALSAILKLHLILYSLYLIYK